MLIIRRRIGHIITMKIRRKGRKKRTRKEDREKRDDEEERK